MPYYAEHCAAMLAVTYSSGQGMQRNIVSVQIRMQTLSTTKWCHYAVVLGQRDKDTFRKIPVRLNRLLCKPHVWRVCKAYKLFFPSERDCKLWYPSPPLPKKKQNNVDCYPGRRYNSNYCKVFQRHLLATFAKCDLLKFFSMKKIFFYACCFARIFGISAGSVAQQLLPLVTIYLMLPCQVTTDWRLGTGTGCTDKHTGTSAAAPLAAGMIALMLQAR